MTLIICTIILFAAVVWVVAFYDWGKLLSAFVLLIFVVGSVFFYFNAKSSEISIDVKCDRMHGVLIKQQGETSCVDRDSIKPIDLDKVFNE